MLWKEITLCCLKQNLEPFEDYLLEAGAVSVTYQDAKDQPILEPGVDENPLWDEVVLVALFEESSDIHTLPKYLSTQFKHRLIGDVSYREFEDKDWVRSWMDEFHPLKIGNRLWICPSWQTPPALKAVNIMLDPGLAFGSGTHPTTALCLKWLDQHITDKHRILDFGCGSGILAIAARKLGATEVIAIDNDPQAIMATRDNAKRNDIKDGFGCYLPEEMPERFQSDIVIANILAGILIALKPVILRHLKTRGQLVLSGILHDQVDEVINAYKSEVDFQTPVYDGDWALLSGSRK
ncbi:MAG: 50S ribosomal protein L11 methyltransferase [Francisellaceae bacterium]